MPCSKTGVESAALPSVALLPFFRTRRGTRHRARASQDALRIPRPPSSIGRPRSVIFLFAESLMSISRDTRRAIMLDERTMHFRSRPFELFYIFFILPQSTWILSLERFTPKTTFDNNDVQSAHRVNSFLFRGAWDASRTSTIGPV